MRIPRSAMAVAPAAEQLVPFQIVMPDGQAVAERVAALGLKGEKLLQLYRGMLTIRLMDERLLTLQRQGRISFYGEARGQETIRWNRCQRCRRRTTSCPRCAKREPPSTEGCR